MSGGASLTTDEPIFWQLGSGITSRIILEAELTDLFFTSAPDGEEAYKVGDRVGESTFAYSKTKLLLSM